MANLTPSPVGSPAAGPLPTPRSWARSLDAEALLVVALVAVSFLAHALNMFNFPSFTWKDDEGIYAAQAWAILRMGQLTPYTYWYDHAPGGWIMIAGWMGLTGGPHTFGGAVDSGRVLMLVLHLAMVPLLYRLVRKLGGGPLPAALAVLFFSLSPLALFYQRLLLLDNIALFWILLSVELLLDGWGRLSRTVLSGICFAMALLAKETAIVLLPAMLLIAFHQRWEHHGPFAIGGWLVPMGLVVSWYPLFALLKGELWPTVWPIEASATGGPPPGVSLLNTLLWQASREGGGMFNLQNSFWELVREEWLPLDALLLIGGTAAILINLVRGFGSRHALVAGLLGLLPLAYLARGGVVFGYYMCFVVPFFCLNIGVVLAPLLNRFRPAPAAGLAALSAAGLLALYTATGALQPFYTANASQAGRDAIAWIKANLPEDSLIVGRDDMWADLHEPGAAGPAFTGYHSHWKVSGDPAIRDGVFRNDWRNVDYLVVSPGLIDGMAASDNTIGMEALRNAQPVKLWVSDGMWVQLWKVSKPGLTEQRLLADVDATIERRFEQAGAIVGPGGTVTSEAQGYAMLRAVWSNDRPAFERTWAWTQRHLLNDDGLPAWEWRDGAVRDPNSAADASTDIALALLLAARRWDDPALEAAGIRTVRAIWEREVVQVGGRPYLAAGDWAAREPVVAINPSYFAPYAYRIFAEVDPEHNWRGLIDTSYELLFAASQATFGADRSAGLPPNWIGLDRRSGELAPVQLGDRLTTDYGYDAARAYWRVALDLRWSGDGRAAELLGQNGFLRDEVRRKGYVSAVYARSGDVVQEAPSVVGTAGAVAVLLNADKALADLIFARQIVGGVERDPTGVSWGNPDDRYSLEWAWFAVALYADALPNLWEG